jgi:hypothetical protein
MPRCKYCLIVGAGLCACGLFSSELFEFKLPSAIACSSPPIHSDFGPPAGCENEPLPHSRMGWMTSVATSTGTGAMFSMVLRAPIIANTYRDIEDAAAFYDAGVDITQSMNDGSVASSLTLPPPMYKRRGAG